MFRCFLVLNIIGFIYGQGGGYALDSDGSNDYVNMGNVLNLTSAISIETWVKTDGLGSRQTIAGKGYPSSGEPYYQYHVEVRTGGEIYFPLSLNGTRQTTQTSATLTASQWHHIACVYNGSSIKVYIDGVEESSTNASGSISTYSSSFYIGAYSGHTSSNVGNFDGFIDEVRIWNDARTVAEIQEYMHKEVASDASGLVAYYKMSDGSGTSLTDNSSNNNTGTLTNMVTSGGSSDWVTSYAPIGDLGSSYETDVEGIWKVSGTNESDASNGLTMTVSSALSSGNFAVFGNNNTNSTSQADLASVASTERTGRIWQIDESGTVAATIKIDMSDATGISGNTGTASNYRLLYRSGTSGDFSSVATGSSISGDVITFNSVSVQDGYYALGAQSDATLPVELTSFELLETRNDGITLQWITESEINNLGFNLDRRTPLTNWTQIASYVTHPSLQGQGSVSHQTIYTFTDNTVQENKSYDYRLSDVDYNGNVEYHSLQLMGVSSSKIPEQFILYPNYPNPFNPVTTIRYDLSNESFVNITIYDMLGNVVYNLVNTNQSSGYKSVQWNATNNQGEPVSAGVYLYKIQAGDFVDTKKMILLK